VARQGADVHEREIGITPFDCPRDNQGWLKADLRAARLRWPSSAASRPDSNVSRVRRAICVPYRRVNHGTERTTTVNGITTMTWPSLALAA